MNTQSGYSSQQGSTSLPEMRFEPTIISFEGQLLKQHSRSGSILKNSQDREFCTTKMHKLYTHGKSARLAMKSCSLWMGFESMTTGF